VLDGRVAPLSLVPMSGAMKSALRTTKVTLSMNFSTTMKAMLGTEETLRIKKTLRMKLAIKITATLFSVSLGA
jgi:hypothetical protein